MRKTVCLFAALGLLLLYLTGCEKTQANLSETIYTNFTASADICFKGIQMECTVTRSTSQTASVSILKPDILNGMTFTLENGQQSISYQGLSCNSETSLLPQTCFVSAMLDVLSVADCPDQLRCVSSDKGHSAYLGECPSGEFKITVNDKTGFIEKIEIKELDFSADFVTCA